jgi:amidase
VPLGALPANTTVITNQRGDLNATAPNIPFGLAFAGSLWSEEALIGFAYAFEQRTMVRGRVVPYLVPGIEIENVVGSY